MADPDPDPDLELTATAMAAGGDAITRDGDGRVVFVSDALPGERVRARVVQQKRDYARAEIVEVLDASPDRIEPMCPAVALGCGGCGWQHVEPSAQRRLKAGIVEDALRRIGHVDPPPIGLGPDLPTDSYRTTVRCAVVGGRAGFRRARSHDVLVVDGCPVTHPLLDELIRDGRYGDATEVTLRVGVASGERVAVVAPSAKGVIVPDGVVVVGADQLRGSRRPAIHETVAGRTWQVSAGSFFQARPDGADALVTLALDAVRDRLGADDVVVDLYAGVGLFAGAVAAATGARAIAVERQAIAVRDAHHNLGALRAKVIRADVERWRPVPAGAVIADPSRAGLGTRGADVVAGTRAGVAVLVSCDPASLGRDTALLAARGYRLDRVTLVDLFPHTAHIEAVSVFLR